MLLRDKMKVTMNMFSSTGLLPIVITVVVIVIGLFLLMTTRAGFG